MSQLCRYCREPVQPLDFRLTLAYWNQTADCCHAACKESGEKQEAIACQIIDADCNDCKHYKRCVLAPNVVSKVKTPDGRIVDVIYKPMVYIKGTCLKFNKEVVAQPKKWSGLECFEHRKS